MHLLKSEDGFTIIESLVSLVLLGLLVAFTVTCFNNFFYSSKILLRNEALQLASDEINRTIADENYSDTLYKNISGNLILLKQVVLDKNLYDISVKVSFSENGKELESLNVKIKK